MGSVATRGDARLMRDALLREGLEHTDTLDIDNEEFCRIMDAALDVEHDLDAAERALREAGFAIGDEIIAGEGEDRERGRIVGAVDATMARVAWSQGTISDCPIDLLESR
jgi:hypothetical protein